MPSVPPDSDLDALMTGTPELATEAGATTETAAAAGGRNAGLLQRETPQRRGVGGSGAGVSGSAHRGASIPESARNPAADMALV